MNAEAILAKLTELRRSIPHLSRSAPEPQSRTIDARTAEEFEVAAIADALETLTADVAATIAETERRVYESALDVYYATEALARDPEHPETIPHVEAMRAAHKKAYGKPVPPKEETERRRKVLGVR
jgi:hypothetical protein